MSTTNDVNISTNTPIFNINEADMAMKQQALHSVL